MSEIIEGINQADSIIVYGTKKNGQDAFAGLHFLCPEKIVGFAVTRTQDEENDVFGYPVQSIEEYSCLLDKNPLIIVSTREDYYAEIVSTIENMGFCNYCLYGDGNSNQIELHRVVEDREQRPFAVLKNEVKRIELNKIACGLLGNN